MGSTLEKCFRNSAQEYFPAKFQTPTLIRTPDTAIILQESTTICYSEWIILIQYFKFL